MGSCEVDRLSEAGVICACRLCGGCDRPEIIDVLRLDGCGIKSVRELFESLGGLLYFLV